MPNPTYLTTVNGDSDLLLRVSGSDFLYIKWAVVPFIEQTSLLEFFDDYDFVSSVAPASGTGPWPGFQFIDFDAVTLTDTTGLTPTKTYTFDIEVDGADLSFSYLGSALATYQDMINAITADLAGVATVTLETVGPHNNHILIKSLITGTSSNVRITDESMFLQANNVVVLPYRHGGNDLLDVAELTIRTVSYTHLTLPTILRV